MPVAPTYPGVYIEEIPSGVRTITGVATSVAAFLGYFSRGPMDQPVRLFNFGDFERALGGLRVDSEASYAIQQFFLNGGGQAYGVRVAADTAASITLNDAAGVASLQLTADALEDAFTVDVEHTDGSTTTFDLTVTVGTNVGSVTAVDQSTVAAALDDDANWTDVSVVTAAVVGPNRPGLTGTLGDAIAATGLAIPLEAFEVLLNGELLGELTWTSTATTDSGVATALQTLLRTIAGLGAATVVVDDGRLRVRTGTDDADVVSFADIDAGTIVSELGLDGVRASRQAHGLVRGGAVASGRTLRDTDGDVQLDMVAANPGVWGDGIAVVVDYDTAEPLLNTQFNLTVVEGGTTEVFRNLVMDTASPRYAVDVVNAGSALVQLALPDAAPAVTQRPVAGAGILHGGADGGLPGAVDLIGSEATKSGMFALLDVDLFNLLSIPDTMRLADAEAALVAAAATELASDERAFYILDAPQPADNPLDLPTEIEAWLNTFSSLRHKNVALYYPRPAVPDPLNDFRLREVASSGTMAGVYARTDGTRGVWKAPAGSEAVLRGTQRLEYTLTDQENGALNPLGINALRTFPVYGTVAWGARTLRGADQLASEWKYVPIRRLALYIEESLFRGTQWVVFEPNDEKLWAQIRLNVTTFMHTLFRQGAFQGTSPAAAYFVQCDAEVNPQADIDAGIVNVVVGFAPLKPAEFVFVKIQQMAGQLEL